MIFVTLGSQKYQFNRLLEAIDKLDTDEEIFAQIGYSDYIPKNFKFKFFLDRDEFKNTLDKCDILITHGGTGAIITGVKGGKKVVAVPRLQKYGEHIDDHQIQLVRQFKEMNLIYDCEDMDLDKALKIVKSTEYKKYISNTRKIIKSLEDFIEA